MNYNTDFSGDIEIFPPLNEAEISYLHDFSETRHMSYSHNRILEVHPDLDAGRSPELVDGNKPPKPKPGLWCHWVVEDNGRFLTTDDGEKIYYHVQWLSFIIGHLLTPSNPRALINAHRDNDPRLAEFVDHTFLGEIQVNEDSGDLWAIRVGNAADHYSTPGTDVGTADLHEALSRIPAETLADLTARLDPYS